MWSLWTRYACTAFYSHPWAWNEIGFPGPAYPRGYLNPGVDAREHWEVADSGTEDSDIDPVPFADRVEQARREHARLLGAGQLGVRSNYRDIRARNESAWLIPNDGTRTNHRLRADMRRYADGDEVDLVVVGAGAGGSVLTQRLARAGWRVVCLDAGPFWDPDTDWVSDERGAHTLYWTEPRQIGGADPVPLGSNNSGRGVGGSMVHYAGYTPRFHPSDFRTFTARRGRRGLADRLRRPEAVLRAHRAGTAGRRAGLAVGRPAQLPAPRAPGRRQRRDLPARRESRRHRGPGRAGRDPQRPLRQPAALHLPRLLPAGLQGQRQGQPADHPHPRRARPRRRDPPRQHGHPRRRRRPHRRGHRRQLPARRREHYQRARAVAVAGYSIETPRLLLLSATERYPHGLGNDHDQVGRYLMVQGAPQTAGRFDDEIRMYKAPPPEVSSEQFYETDPTKPYKRGWSIQTVSPLPITWAEHVTAQGHWGAPLREYMRDYVHWATLGALCEYLPQADNRVTLADEKDRHGLPVAHFSYSQCDNDKQLTKAATASMEDHPDGRRRQRGDDHRPLRPPRRRRPDGRPRRGRRRRPRPPRLRRPEPLRRRRQHAAHPRLGQPGADHHGAGRPRRRPAHQPGPPRPHRSSTAETS